MSEKSQLKVSLQVQQNLHLQYEYQTLKELLGWNGCKSFETQQLLFSVLHVGKSKVQSETNLRRFAGVHVDFKKLRN